MKKITITLISSLSLAVALTAQINTNSCLGCHGTDWSKAALGKSKVVSDMNQSDIASSLKGYKDGTYGGTMKGVMKGQVAKYSNEELDAMAISIKPE